MESAATEIPLLDTDGVFGNKTRNAVIAFQKHYALSRWDCILLPGQEWWRNIPGYGIRGNKSHKAAF